MKGSWRVAAGVAALSILVFAENLFGRELNALFLKYPGIDKGLHVLEYGSIFACVWWLTRDVAGTVRRRVLLTTVTVVLLAFTDEFVQGFAPGRSVEAFDLAADWAGITLAAIVIIKPSKRVMVPVTAMAIATAAYVAYDTHVKLIDYSRALQYEHDHDFVRAREHYLRAVAAGQHSATVYNGLAWVSIESGVADPHEAVKYVGAAFAEQPTNADILDTYGWALHHVGRHTDALDLLQKAYGQQPDMYCIHYHLGQVYLALSRETDAEEHYRQQVKLTGTREAAMASAALARMTSAHNR